jgi:8-oxo-dGTP pyrophosphatase MutT (NUDIX family)
MAKRKTPTTAAKAAQQRVYGGIIKSHTLYAVVQGNYTGKWSFPKGHAHKEEYPIETAIREIQEEVGLTNLPSPTGFLRLVHGCYFVFELASTEELRSSDDEEIGATRWCTTSELKTLPVNIDILEYIKKGG